MSAGAGEEEQKTKTKQKKTPHTHTSSRILEWEKKRGEGTTSTAYYTTHNVNRGLKTL